MENKVLLESFLRFGKAACRACNFEGAFVRSSKSPLKKKAKRLVTGDSDPRRVDPGDIWNHPRSTARDPDGHDGRWSQVVIEGGGKNPFEGFMQRISNLHHKWDFKNQPNYVSSLLWWRTWRFAMEKPMSDAFDLGCRSRTSLLLCWQTLAGSFGLVVAQGGWRFRRKPKSTAYQTIWKDWLVSCATSDRQPVLELPFLQVWGRAAGPSRRVSSTLNKQTTFCTGSPKRTVVPFKLGFSAPGFSGLREGVFKRGGQECALHLHGSSSWDLYAPFYSSRSSQLGQSWSGEKSTFGGTFEFLPRLSIWTYKKNQVAPRIRLQTDKIPPSSGPDPRFLWFLWRWSLPGPCRVLPFPLWGENCVGPEAQRELLEFVAVEATPGFLFCLFWFLFLVWMGNDFMSLYLLYIYLNHVIFSIPLTFGFTKRPQLGRNLGNAGWGTQFPQLELILQGLWQEKGSLFLKCMAPHSQTGKWRSLALVEKTWKNWFEWSCWGSFKDDCLANASMTGLVWRIIMGTGNVGASLRFGWGLLGDLGVALGLRSARKHWGSSFVSRPSIFMHFPIFWASKAHPTLGTRRVLMSLKWKFQTRY